MAKKQQQKQQQKDKTRNKQTSISKVSATQTIFVLFCLMTSLKHIHLLIIGY